MPNRSKYQTRRHHYAVLWTAAGPNRWTNRAGIAMWRRLTRKADALRLADVTSGRAYAIAHGARDAWDAPTFAAVGDCIAIGGSR